MLRFVFLYVFLLLGVNTLFGQCVFHKLYRNSDVLSDFGDAIIQTNSGGYIAVGSTAPQEATDAVFIVKTDNCGDTIWQKAYNMNTIGACPGVSVIELSDNSIMVGGWRYSAEEGASDSFLFKLNANGDSLWSKTVEGGFSDVSEKYLLDDDQGFIVTGYNYDSTFSYSQVFLLKTDSLGNVEWQQEYGDSLFLDYVYGLDKTPDGGYVISGEFQNPATTSWDIFLIKTDSMGNQLWKKYYGNGYEQYQGVVQTTLDSGFIIAGRSYDANNNRDGYIIKTDSTGEMIWEKTYGTSQYGEHFMGIRQLNDGSYIVCGSKLDTLVDPVRPRIWLLKVDSQGDTLWSRTHTYFGNSAQYGSVTHDYVEDIQLTTDGGFVMTGFIINNQLPAKNDLFILKTDSMGYTCLIDTNTWQGCDDMVAVVEVDEIDIYDDILFYPNPTTLQINLSCLPCESEQATLLFYDLTGKLQGKYTIYEAQQTIDLTRYSTGVYIYRLTTTKESYQGKVVVY